MRAFGCLVGTVTWMPSARKVWTTARMSSGHCAKPRAIVLPLSGHSNTRNDPRNGRALEPGNVHAENSRSISWPLRRSSLRHLPRRSRHRPIRHASLRTFGESKRSSIGSPRHRVSSWRWASRSPFRASGRQAGSNGRSSIRIASA